MSERDGGPAFPEAVAVGPSGDVYPGMSGMSLRDWFAGHALSGWLSSFGEMHPHPAESGTSEAVARNSYALADALLEARAAAKGAK